MAFPDKFSGRMPPPKNPMLAIAIQAKPKDHDEPDADENGGPSDEDQDDSGNWAEWLDYHGEADRCDACQFMAQDGTCPKVKMQVDPGGHCEAFTAKHEGADTGGMPAMGGGPPQRGGYGS